MWCVGTRTCRTTPALESRLEMTLLRPVLVLMSAAALSVTLTACGSSAWTAESVDAALLTSDDFDVAVSRAEEDPAFEKDDGDLFFYSVEDCPANERIKEILNRGDALGSVGFEGSAADLGSFSITQQAFQLGSADDVTEIISVLRDTVESGECTTSETGSDDSMSWTRSSEFDNARDLKDAFDLEVSNSLVWDARYAATVSGSESVSRESEGRVIVASQGSSMLIVYYVREVGGDSSEFQVEAGDLENAIEKSLRRFFP